MPSPRCRPRWPRRSDRRFRIGLVVLHHEGDLAPEKAAMGVDVVGHRLHGLQHARAVIAAGAVLGGWLGALALRYVNEKLIRGLVVVLGIALTIGLFIRAH